MGEVVSRNHPYTGHAFDYENFSAQQKCINNLLTLKEKKITKFQLILLKLKYIKTSKNTFDMRKTIVTNLTNAFLMNYFQDQYYSKNKKGGKEEYTNLKGYISVLD